MVYWVGTGGQGMGIASDQKMAGKEQRCKDHRVKRRRKLFLMFCVVVKSLV
jgi:hypothetical protein